MLDNLHAWRHASSSSLEPCCFVDLDDYFTYCNSAWCRLLGYSEFELKTMRWQDITAPEEVGADEGELRDTKNNYDKKSYYLEKIYIRKDKTKIKVGIYVNKFPPEGEAEGLIVFCRTLQGSSEYEELKNKFLEIEKTVNVLSHIEGLTNNLGQKIEDQSCNIKQNRELILSIIKKDNVSIGTNNVGNNGNTGNTSSSNNDSRVILYLITGFGFLVTGLITLGIVLAYMSYYGNGDANMEKPDIKQIEFGTQE